jgi:dipeptidyl aminopeptidase/acylaminoacyl peptidase
MDQHEARPLPGTEGALTPSFSLDNQWLAYFTGGDPGQFKKVAVSGGAPQTLLQITGGYRIPSWGPDDNILYSAREGLVRLSPAVGKPELLAPPDAAKGEVAFALPQLLPGGKSILVTIALASGAQQIAILDLKTGEKTILIDGEGLGRYAPTGVVPGREADTGHIVYLRGSSLMAVPFDVAQRRILGPAVPVLEGAASPSFSSTGTLAFVPNLLAQPNSSTLVWLDRKGLEDSVAVPPRNYRSIELSPKGDRAALTVAIPSIPPVALSDVWVSDLERGTLTPVTFNKTSTNAIWTMDGQRLIYVTQKGVLDFDILSAPADGSGKPAPLVTDSGGHRPAVSPNGNVLLGMRITRRDMWILPLEAGSAKDGNSTPAPQTIESQSSRLNFQFSPDGKWLVYSSNESGRSEIYVAPYPGLDGKFPISTGGGALPRWKGREIFYMSGQTLMAVEVQTTPVFKAGIPKALFDGNYRAYDVASDGKRFLMLKPVVREQPVAPADLHVIVNWFEELRQKAPAANMR